MLFYSVLNLPDDLASGTYNTNILFSLTCGPDDNQTTEKRSLSIRKIVALAESSPTSQNHTAEPEETWINAASRANILKFKFPNNQYTFSS